MHLFKDFRNCFPEKKIKEVKGFVDFILDIGSKKSIFRFKIMIEPSPGAFKYEPLEIFSIVKFVFSYVTRIFALKLLRSVSLDYQGK